MFLSKILIHLCMNIITPQKKQFCHYCLQAFSAAEILKRYVNDCFKINDKQIIKMP